MTALGGASDDALEDLLALLGDASDEELLEAIVALPPESVEALLSASGQEARQVIPSSPLGQAKQLHDGYVARSHVRLLSARLAEAVHDVERGRSRRVLVSMPPRMGKSTIGTLYLVIWLLRRHPEWSYILTSHDGGLATSWGRMVQRALIENPGLGVGLARNPSAASEWETTAGGSVLSRGIRGSITGRGARVLIIDDPVKDFVDAHSPIVREAVWNWWLTTSQPRLEPPSLVLVIMCMTGDTPVLRPDGTETPLRDIRPGDEIATYDQNLARLTTSRVLNWTPQGRDKVFEIRMKSGVTVRANARHPFLTVENGVETWRRTDTLRPGSGILRATGASTGESSARSMSARSLPEPGACACRTTTRPDGPRVIDLPPRTRSPAGPPTSRIGTGSRLRSTTGSSLIVMEPATSAAIGQLRTPAGTDGWSSTMTIEPAICAACSARRATSSSRRASLPSGFDLHRSTWPVTLDEVIEVVPAGEAEVYDIEVEGTHNFVANGLITLNTRWHEDDFAGRLLSDEHAGDPGEWEVIRLPALADSSDDVLGREQGEPLLSPLLPDETPEQAVQRWEGVKRDVGTYTFACTPAESPVLMADWTTRPISEVRTGDTVLGFERGTPEERARAVPSRVLRVMRYTGRVQRLVMESGSVVRCTADHRWYTGRAASAREPRRKTYAPASAGSRLLRIAPMLAPLTPERQRDLDYMAGMLDGEGHFRSNVVTITQDSRANPDVYARIRATLDRLGWGYREEVREPEHANSFRLRDTRMVIHELLDRTDLGKRGRALAVQWSSPRKPVRERDRVLAVVDEGEEPVYALETTTGNYVVWGFASSNSMYQQRPAPAKGAIFDNGWWRFWTSDPDKVTDDGRVVLLPDGPALTRARWLDSWDCAFKGEKDSDYVVGQRWCRAGAHRYLVAQQRSRMTFTQTLGAMARWSINDDDALSPFGRLVHERLVEDKANGTAIIDVMRERVSGLIAINPTTSKVARARAITPECESGNVYLPHPGDPGNEWVPDTLSELRNFPHDANDDTVDALTQALSRLRDQGRGGVTVPGRAAGQQAQAGRAIPRDIARAALSERRRGAPTR